MLAPDEDLYILEAQKMFECAITRPLTNNTIIIHAYYGGKWSPQNIPFTSAVSRLPHHNLTIEYMNCDDVKSAKWGIKELIDWLQASHVHMITTHVHQGYTHQKLDMAFLQTQLQRLHYHDGFPTGNFLRCPVFTQDKYEYLSVMGSLANPTLRIYLNESGDFTYMTQVIRR